jgi:hypothetical protein
LTGRIAAELAAPQGRHYRFIARLAGEIRMRRWRKSASMPVSSQAFLPGGRGFHDNGFARTILLVEPEQPFLGTTRLDKLPYRNVDLTQFYPYGNPAYSG